MVCIYRNRFTICHQMLYSLFGDQLISNMFVSARIVHSVWWLGCARQLWNRGLIYSRARECPWLHSVQTSSLACAALCPVATWLFPQGDVARTWNWACPFSAKIKMHGSVALLYCTTFTGTQDGVIHDLQFSEKYLYTTCLNLWTNLSQFHIFQVMSYENILLLYSLKYNLYSCLVS
jgi:hypothetical protein